MAEFECKVYKLEILPHPNADAIELAKVGDYLSIVKKDDFKTGDLGIYIPEAAICPDWLIIELSLEGKLAGSNHNRVKAIKLRGILSQGLIYPVSYDTSYNNADNIVPVIFNDKNERFEVNEGDVVTNFLGITKWEPPIPVHMAGEVWNAHGMTLKYDIENFKKYPNVIQESEHVVMTEKIHGTWACFGYHPEHEESHIITSNGLSAQGLAFKINEANAKNLYIRALDSTAPYADGTGGNVLDRMHAYLACDTKWGIDVAFYILGEVYGKGVQDLTYGADKPQFRAFDIYIGSPGQGRYLDYAEFVNACQYIGIERVPTLYNGPFSKEKMMHYTDGMESVSGNAKNIREGVVIKPIHERNDIELGRVILKSVSEKYLLRKDGTEYN